MPVAQRIERHESRSEESGANPVQAGVSAGRAKTRWLRRESPGMCNSSLASHTAVMRHTRPARLTPRRLIAVVYAVACSWAVPSSALAEEPGATEPSVTVVGHREPGAATDNSLQGAELTTLPGTAGDPARTFSALPGVGRPNLGLGSDFSVRGASPENTGYFIDGFPVLNLFHFAYGPSVVPPEIVRRNGLLSRRVSTSVRPLHRWSGRARHRESRHRPTPRERLDRCTQGVALGGTVVRSRPRNDRRVGAEKLLRNAAAASRARVQLNYADAGARVEYRFSDHVRAAAMFFVSYDVLDATQARSGGPVNLTSATMAPRLEYLYWRATGHVEYAGPRGLLLRWSGMVGYDQTRPSESVPDYEYAKYERHLADFHGGIRRRRACIASSSPQRAAADDDRYRCTRLFV